MMTLHNLLHELYGHFGELCVLGRTWRRPALMKFFEGGETADSGSDWISLGRFCEVSGRRNVLLKGGGFRMGDSF